MAVVIPKTIMIRSFASKSHLAAMSEQNGAESVLESGRKRKRLTHLSPEERMMRRKLKNRVAAQTARDRKKQRMDELEIVLAQLQAENKKLQSENGALRQHTDSLEVQNLVLKRRLGLEEEEEEEGCVIEGGSGRVTESAALAVPLQKELVHALYSRATHYLALCYTISLMCSLSFYSRLVRANTASTVTGHRMIHCVTRSPQRRLPMGRQTPRRKWWGPRQRNWNPSMN